jgi:hypothetical protein
LIVDTLENTPTRFALHVEREPGAINSQRLRSYQRIDNRWTRYFDTARGRVSLFGEVYNLRNTENPRGWARGLRVAGRNVTVQTEEITQWPRMPIVGLTWEF